MTKKDPACSSPLPDGIAFIRCLFPDPSRRCPLTRTHPVIGHSHGFSQRFRNVLLLGLITDAHSSRAAARISFSSPPGASSQHIARRPRLLCPASRDLCILLQFGYSFPPHLVISPFLLYTVINSQIRNLIPKSAVALQEPIHGYVFELTVRSTIISIASTKQCKHTELSSKSWRRYYDTPK